MSLTNPNNVITEQRLKDFYDGIFPYLGGSADAGFTPVGSIIAMMSNTAPANYLACDGTVYNISDYPELATHFYQQFGSKNYYGGDGTTTFAVPDLRGEFLRGTGTNSHSGQGNGDNVGTHQDSTQQGIVKTGSADSRIQFWGANADYANPIANADSMVTTRKMVQGNSVALTNKTMSQDFSAMFTSRPTNTSVLFCIATKNIYLDPKNDYSTEEKVVGIWIDGKTIYQRTFTFTALTLESNTWVTSTIPKSSIESIISCKANNQAAAVNYVSAAITNNIDYVRLLSSRPTSSDIDCITLQYTKTTD